MKRFVYRLLDTIDGSLQYVGSSVQPQKRLRALQYRFKRNFNIEIFGPFTEEVACNKELVEIINLRPPLNKNWANHVPGLLGKTHSVETKQKMSEAHKGVKRPPSYGLAMSRILKGRKLSAAHCKKLSESKLANPPSLAARKRFGRMISKALKGRPLADEHRAKIGEALKGNRKSPEHIANSRRGIAAAYARRRALGLPTGNQMQQGSWRDKFLFGEAALLEGKKLDIYQLRGAK